VLHKTEDADELECSKGVAPHAVLRLQRPGGAKTYFSVAKTWLLAGSPAPDTLAAACSALYQDHNIVITYDIETQRAKRLLLRHLHDITDMAAAPTARHGAQHLFATSSKSSDVKIWDVRSSGGAAAVTLAGGSTETMYAVTLASNNNGAAAGASSSSRLGAGMYCFAGGMGQSVGVGPAGRSGAGAV
jgi:WD40 repeat protein